MVTLAVDLQGALCVVVGGGTVAERRTKWLLAAGARVQVISPTLTPGLEQFRADGVIDVCSRAYHSGDTDGATLVISATGEASVDTAVVGEARAAGRLVSAAGDAGEGNAYIPALVRRGPITIAVHSNGASPALTRRLRERLEDLVGPEYGELAQLLAEVRSEVRASGLSEPARRALWERLVTGPALELLARGDRDTARRWVTETVGAAMADA